MLEGILIVVGTATVKVVARMWIKSASSVDIADGLVDGLGAVVPSVIDRRKTARQFQTMAEQVAKQMEPLVEHEFGSLPDNEVTAAVLGVGSVIDGAHDIEPARLFALDFEPTELESRLRDTPAMRVRNDLSENGQLLFDRLLTENCAYIIELATSLPAFTSQAIVEVLRRESAILERMQVALEKLPGPASVRANDFQEFEVRYRRQVARDLDRLQLFGITLSAGSSRYALSTAYITLSATAREGTSETQQSVEAKASVSTTLGDTLGDGSDSAEFLRVDDVLARGVRHLIRGEAGSGKTTLLQWLAVSAARGAFPIGLEEWNDYVPFFLQLRRYAGGQLPAPAEFLAYNSRVLAGSEPRGWVDSVLGSGRALVLVDGVDELPPTQRDEAHEWLASLLAEFPDCAFVITTRPPAVPEDWLDDSDFCVAELLPMSLPDINAFVRHWHDAARATADSSTEEYGLLGHYEEQLLRVIRDTPTIRSLATAPLLCAMLCALNRDRRTQLPKDRMELYRIALESLLDRRDVERDISQHDSVQLGLREKEALLKSLAFWLIINGQSDASRADAVAHIAEHLNSLASVSYSAEEVFVHLLTRSGLIREPVAGRVDFIHRTFQEYLAASRAVSDGSLPLLINNAHDDQWREVIILGAGHASPDAADRLLTGLLDRGDNEPDLRHRLHLLAVACLGTVVEMSPQVAGRVQRALQNCVPPANMTDARAVASAGDVAAPLLTQFAGANALVAAACVRALCLIGGESGLAALSEFGRDRRVTVARELLRGWDYFDRETYAREVLVESPLDRGWVSVEEVEAMAAVSRLRRLRKLRFTVPPIVPSLGGVPNLDLVTNLEVPIDSELENLDGIGNCDKLLSLRVLGGKFVSLPALPPSIVEVELRHAHNVRDVSALAGLPSLEFVRITRASRIRLEQFEGAAVRDLDLAGIEASESDGTWIRSLGQLRSLRLSGRGDGAAVVPLGEASNCGHLADLSSLESLQLFGSWPGLSSLDGLPPSLTSVGLMSVPDLEDASVLAQFSSMDRLTVDGSSRLRDFSFLRSLDELRILDLENCPHFSDLDLVASTSTMGSLFLARSGITSIAGIGRFEALTYLRLQGCELESLEPLLETDRRLTVAIDFSQRQLVTEEIGERHRIRFTRASA